MISTSKKIASFSFNEENMQLALKTMKKYPEGKQASALIALLYMAQKQNEGWLSMACIEYIASLLEISAIKVYEVASFYTMFNLKPVGKYLLQVCGTTPCWLRGADQILTTCKNKLKIEVGETTKDKLFTLMEVECLGACANAPMMQINDDYYEDLTPEIIEDMLDKLAKNQEIKIGSQIGRSCSSPIEGDIK